MELLIRVSRPGHETTDLRVEIDPDQPASRLAAGIADHLSITGTHLPRLLLARTGNFLDPDVAVAETGVVSGDEVVLDPPGPATPPAPTPLRAVSLDVLAGPDSGQSAVMHRGTWILGRDDSCDLMIGDPTVSLPREARDVIDATLDGAGRLAQALRLPAEVRGDTPVSVVLAGSLYESGGRTVNRSLERVLWPADALAPWPHPAEWPRRRSWPPTSWPGRPSRRHGAVARSPWPWILTPPRSASMRAPHRSAPRF